MSIVYSSFLETEIGRILITANNDTLLSVDFTNQKIEEHENLLTKSVKQELVEYFNGTRTSFSFFPYDLYGFQKKVLEQVLMIPYGATASYYKIAKALGNGKAVRAVANAISKNPYLILIPCHRVIGKDGALHGYRGGIEKKAYLLEKEKKHCQKDV